MASAERIAKLPKWAQQALIDAENRQVSLWGLARCGECKAMYIPEEGRSWTSGEKFLTMLAPKKKRGGCQHDVSVAEMWMGDNRGWQPQGVLNADLPPIFAAEEPE